MSAGSEQVAHPILTAAEAYVGRGWSVLPVPYRSKSPVITGWPQLRITAGELPRYFGNGPQNISILLGDASGGLVDVDLDHPLAVELADQFLPETTAVFGRAGKPRSHRFYRVQPVPKSRVFRSPSVGTLVEIRSGGLQTIVPPSTHVGGDAIEWDEPDAEPATIMTEELIDAVERLAAAVQIELGETPAPKRSEHTAIRTKPTLHAPARIDACLVAMRRIPIRDHHDGSLRLYACACRAVEFDLDDDDAVLVIRRYMRERPFRREWSDDDIVRRMRDAERRCQRGLAIALAEDGLIALGGCDPVTGRLVLSPKRTIPRARAFVREFYDHPEARTIHSYAGDLWEWRQNRYQLVEPAAVKRSMQDWLHGALRYQAKNKVIELVPFESNPLSVNTAIETLHNEVHLSSDTQSPSWLIDDNTRPPASEILVGQASFWHLPTSTRLSGTPLLFTVNSLSFDPDPSAPAPGEWLTFLERLFGADRQQIELLQDWFGYCLTGNTSQQKILLLVGPKRSGKGTIARVLTVLVGPGNLCGPTTSSLAGPFGLQPLLGKSLAIVSDARFSGENVTTVVERLLCISGEDTLTVDRKFQSSVTLKLPTRFMFLSNELPRLNDASAALAGRFLILRLTESFYGREDLGLGKRLLAEMPGILNWAIEGWKRLHRRGRFVQPSSVAELVRDLEELASPVSAFIRDECVLGAGYRISTGDLYQAWRCWCENDGRSTPSTKHVFGRDLIAAAPQVVTRRGTDMQRFYDGITLRSTIESIQRFDCRDYRVSSNCTRMRSEKE